MLIACGSLSAHALGQEPSDSQEGVQAAPVDSEAPDPEEPGEAEDAPREQQKDEELTKRVELLEKSMAARPPESVPPVSPERTIPLLRPTVLGELDYRVYPSEVEGITGFSIGRLRPGLSFNPAPWFQATASFEFAGEYPVIMDAFIRLRAADWAEFTIGYSKPPLFASFIYEPVHSLPFPDRAPVVSSFRVRRDVGVDVHFMPRHLPIEAWLRVGNGSGSPLGNDSMTPAGYANLDWVVGRARPRFAGGERDFGLRIGVSGLIESVRDRDGIIGQTPFGFVYFRPIVVSGLRGVGEGHAIVYLGPFRFTAEGAVARESRSRDTDGNPATPREALPAMASYGLTTELAWVIRGAPRVVGRAPEGSRGPDGGWNGGAIEAALRYDGMWLGREADDVRPGGSQGGAATIKWWATDFFATTLAGYAIHYDVPPIEEPSESWSWGLVARASFFWGLPGQAAAARSRGSQSPE